MLPPLTGARYVTGLSLDVPVAVLCVLAGAGYLWAARRAPAWSRGATAWFLAGGLGSLLLATCSCLGTYDRELFWALAVQDVLVLTIVPIGLTLGRPVALWRAAGLPQVLRAPAGVRRLVGFPLVGSVVAVGLLLTLYVTGWDAARLAHPALLEVTRLVLLAAGCLFLWPLLGVDEATGGTGYPLRAAIAFVDGLLDAVPGLAVLGAGPIAAAHYASLGRTWGPSPHADQQLGGTLMVALSELVGLPALLVLLVRWVRSDAREAAAFDALDEAEEVVGRVLREQPDAADLRVDTPAEGVLRRPWWENDPGPLADRGARYGWGRRPQD